MELSNPWIRQGQQEGQQVQAVKLVTRLLMKRLGTLSPERVEAIGRLPLDRLENLAEAVFEIHQDGDLDAWLT